MGFANSLPSLNLQGEETDLLFITTERYQFCVIAYDPDSNEIVTKAKGDIKVCSFVLFRSLMRFIIVLSTSAI